LFLETKDRVAIGYRAGQGSVSSNTSRNVHWEGTGQGEVGIVVGTAVPHQSCIALPVKLTQGRSNVSKMRFGTISLSINHLNG